MILPGENRGKVGNILRKQIRSFVSCTPSQGEFFPFLCDRTFIVLIQLSFAMGATRHPHCSVSSPYRLEPLKSHILLRATCTARYTRTTHNPQEWRAGRTWRRDYGKCTDRECARCTIPALPRANVSFITE
jgi:hypothetical protein